MGSPDCHPADMGFEMAFRPVSEKTAEILFNRSFLHAFPLGSLELYAPSSVEEFHNGYDAKVVGRSTFSEIYLQFKSPTYSDKRDQFTIQLTPHQHRLLKAYPPLSAYYVAPMFLSLHDLNKAQGNLKTVSENR